jgi:hypothetical protein
MLFFVNTVGERCRFGVSLLANVTENVLSGTGGNFLEADGSSNTNDTVVVVEIDETTSTSTNNSNFATGVQSDEREPNNSSAQRRSVRKTAVCCFLKTIALVSIFL